MLHLIIFRYTQILLAVDYRQENFFVIVDKSDTRFTTFFNTYTDEVIKQASLLSFGASRRIKVW